MVSIESNAALLSATRNALKLVPVNSILQYEKPQDNGAEEILSSLNRDGVLFNPVIVDTVLHLLIDGHHRLAAFKKGGLLYIPAFDVSYMSPVVQIGSWGRFTNAPSSDIQFAFDACFTGQEDGEWEVAATCSSGDPLATCFFKEAVVAARFIDSLSHRLALRPADYATGGQIRVDMRPTAGDECENWKVAVLHAARGYQPFPLSVNRHRVEGRPLGMDIPLDIVDHAAKFGRFIDKLFVTGAPAVIGGGTTYEGRVYRERVVVFRPELKKTLHPGEDARP